MTLDEEFAKYQGQGVLVPGQDESLRGQCFMWFDFVLHDVYGLPYFYAPGAIDIWNNPGWLLDHFDRITDGSIKKGDIVVFNQSVGSVYGHVDIAMQDGTWSSFLGSDSNWGFNKTVHFVNHVGAQYVLGVLRLKGESVMKPSDEQINATINYLHYAYFGKPAPDAVFQSWKGLLQDNYANGLQTIFQATDPNPDALKNKPADPADFEPFTPPALYTKKG